MLVEADFGTVNDGIIFAAGPGSNTTNREQCFPVRIVDDFLNEQQESFTLLLRRVENMGEEQLRTIIQPDRTEIFIVDDDGM